jgi:hypothetical protein
MAKEILIATGGIADHRDENSTHFPTMQLLLNQQQSPWSVAESTAVFSFKQRSSTERMIPCAASVETLLNGKLFATQQMS